MSEEILLKTIKEWLINEKLLGKNTLEIESRLADKITRFCEQSGKLPSGESRGGITSPLQDIEKLVKKCKECELWRTRKNAVFGEGNAESKLVFIGEAPGATEDFKGRPFVGEAGKLLTKLIESIGSKREDVYITNIIKCRPPGNRDPLPVEVEKCYHWLKSQLEIIKPDIISTLGRHSTYTMLGEGGRFSELRGKVYKCKMNYRDGMVKIIPTYHPAALLYHPGWKELAESDFKLIGREYGKG